MKYNRFTPQDQQQNLSMQAKWESILLYGDLSEKTDWIKDNLPLARAVFTDRIQKNQLISPQKKSFILHIIDLYDARAR